MDKAEIKSLMSTFDENNDNMLTFSEIESSTKTMVCAKLQDLIIVKQTAIDMLGDNSNIWLNNKLIKNC